MVSRINYNFNFLFFVTAHNFGLTLRSGQALTSGYATLVLVTSIAKQSRANGNVPFRHSPTTNVDNPNALIEIVAFGSFEVLLTRLVSNNFNR